MFDDVLQVNSQRKYPEEDGGGEIFGERAHDNQRPRRAVPHFSRHIYHLFNTFLSSPLNQDSLIADIEDLRKGNHEIVQEAIDSYEDIVNLMPVELRSPDYGSPPVSRETTILGSPSNKLHIATPTPKTSTPNSRKSVEVPRFFWPEGKSVGSASPSVQQNTIKAEEFFAKHAGSVNYVQFGQLLISIGLPFYWKKPFWNLFCLKANENLSVKMFMPFYKHLNSECPDDAAKFIRILSTAGKFSEDSNSNINNNNRHSSSAYENHGKLPWDLRTAEASMSDFTAMIQDIIDTHPGLGFLRDAPEFHSRYITTVISRIFYKVNRSWTGRMTLHELRRSNLLRVIKRLEEETDVNNIKEYFSYEHFYVIYCKFWELDTDHDLLIDKADLASHSDHSLSNRIIDRIFSGTVLRGWEASSPVKSGPGNMTYSDFVWFLLSEEDKKTPTAIEYWFRCLDLDGDGILSPYELQYFYSEQETRLEGLGIEPLDFKNIYCQIVDMLRCSTTGIRLGELKKNPTLAATVFNTLFNLDKYLEHEQRDPFATATAASGNPDSIDGDTDWDKYATAEYELLIAEENPNDAYHGSDFEDAPTSTLLSP